MRKKLMEIITRVVEQFKKYKKGKFKLITDDGYKIEIEKYANDDHIGIMILDAKNHGIGIALYMRKPQAKYINSFYIRDDSRIKELDEDLKNILNLKL